MPQRDVCLFWKNAYEHLILSHFSLFFVSGVPSVCGKVRLKVETFPTHFVTQHRRILVAWFTVISCGLYSPSPPALLFGLNAK